MVQPIMASLLGLGFPIRAANDPADPKAFAALLVPEQRPLLLAGLAAALTGIALRLWTRQAFQVPLTLWWLMGAGGLLVGALGPTSVWRTLTGQGWTWKGRPLA
jgi:hypothetical protein